METDLCEYNSTINNVFFSPRYYLIWYDYLHNILVAIRYLHQRWCVCSLYVTFIPHRVWWTFLGHTFIIHTRIYLMINTHNRCTDSWLRASLLFHTFIWIFAERFVRLPYFENVGLDWYHNLCWGICVF